MGSELAIFKDRKEKRELYKKINNELRKSLSFRNSFELYDGNKELTKALEKRA